jgi:hypothetical protein
MLKLSEKQEETVRNRTISQWLELASLVGQAGLIGGLLDNPTL